MIRSLLVQCALFCLVLACWSCGKMQPQTQRLVDLGNQEIQSVAVLPFINSSDFIQGGAIVQRIFTSELEQLDDISIRMEGDVRSIYRELKIFPYQLADIEQRRILGSRLKVDVLIGGRIEQMEERKVRNDVDPVLALELHAYDAKSGRTVWTTYYRKEGSDYRAVMHFGLINTVSGLCRQMSREILQEWFPENRQGRDRE